MALSMTYRWLPSLAVLQMLNCLTIMASWLFFQSFLSLFQLSELLIHNTHPIIFNAQSLKFCDSWSASVSLLFSFSSSPYFFRYVSTSKGVILAILRLLQSNPKEFIPTIRRIFASVRRKNALNSNESNDLFGQNRALAIIILLKQKKWLS